MKGCARFLASVALLLFIVSGALAVIFINMRLFLLVPQTYSAALNEEGVYEELPAIIADQLIYGMTYNPCLEDPDACEGEEPAQPSLENGAGVPGYFADLSADDWETMLEALIDPIWIQEQIEQVLDQVFSLLTGDLETGSIVISFETIKSRIEGGAGYDALLEVMQAQPECTPEQLEEISKAILSNALSDSIIQCYLPEDIMSLAEPYIRSGLGEVVGEVPSTIEIDIPQEIYGSGRAATGLSIARGIFRFSPWVALFWLLTVTVLAVRDLRSWAGWWGIGSFLCGLSVLAVGLSSGALLSWGLNRTLETQSLSGISPIFMSSGLRVVNRIAEGFATRLLISSGLLIGIGLVLLVIRFFSQDRSNRKQFGEPLTQPRPEI